MPEAPGTAAYKLLHQRVQDTRGKASEHACAECGTSPARDWSRIHEKEGSDPLDYRPLCRSCHIRYDWDDRYSSEVRGRRTETARRQWARMTPEQRQQRMAGMREAPMTEERRAALSANARKLLAEGKWRPGERQWTDEQRAEQSERIRRSNAEGSTGWAVVNRSRAKLNEDVVRAIRRRLAAGESRALLAAEHDVSYMAIVKIEKRQTWRDVF